MEEKIERRRYPRLTVRLPVQVQTQTGKSLCFTENISANGVLLVSEKPLGLFKEFELGMVWPKEQKRFRLRAVVVRQEKVSQKMYRIALFFTTIDRHTQKWLADHIEKAL